MGKDLTVGERIAFYRRRRGMSQAVLAGLLGKSESWLSKVERGDRRVDRMSVISEIAAVLRVSPSELTGQPYHLDPDGDPFSADAIRHALMEEVAAGGEIPSLDELRAEVRRASALRHATRYSELGTLVPKLIRGCQVATRAWEGDRRREAFGLLAQTYHATDSVLRNLGYVDLAWLAAERGKLAAQQSGDPLLEAVSAFRLAHVFLPAGARREAQDLALGAAATLEPDLGIAAAEHRSAYGALHLVAAIAAARQDDRQTAWACMAEAETAGRLLGQDRNDYETMFGPTNVAIHKVAVAVELGEGGDALVLAENVDPARVESMERQAHHFIDVARAYGQTGNDRAAIRSLMVAERLGPERVRNHPIVREVLRDFLRRERRSANPDLRGLAERSGVLN